MKTELFYLETSEAQIIGEVRFNQYWNKWQAFIDGSLYGEFNSKEEAMQELINSGFKI